MSDHWQGCPMVNPLCPDDLCILEPGHPGSKRNQHIRVTDRRNQRPWKMAHSFMLEPGVTREELIAAAVKRGRELGFHY